MNLTYKGEICRTSLKTHGHVTMVETGRNLSHFSISKFGISTGNILNIFFEIRTKNMDFSTICQNMTRYFLEKRSLQTSFIMCFDTF